MVVDSRVILYLHGGGYVVGSINTHRRLAYDISAASGARATAVVDDLKGRNFANVTPVFGSAIQDPG